MIGIKNVTKGTMTMNNKYSTFVALAAAAIVTSCTSGNITEQIPEQTAPTYGPKTVMLTASVADGGSTATRIGMSRNDDGNTASFYWHKDDEIAVQTLDGTEYKTIYLSTTDETGSASAIFTGTVTGKIGDYALYPAFKTGGCHSFTDTDISYDLPVHYNYKVEGNIFSKTSNGETTYPSNSTNMPMLGKINGNSISFTHIGGVVVIRIEKMPSATGKLTFTANEQICGKFSVEDLVCSTPYIDNVHTAGENSKSVLFDYDGATVGSPGVFYLPLPTGSYSGVKISVEYDGAATQTVNYGNLYVARASINAIPLYTIDDKLSKFSSIDGDVYTLNGHKFIDLGLSSGLLWAQTNVGAETETDAGDYFAWGEVKPKTDIGYSWTTYKYGVVDVVYTDWTSYKCTKYNKTDNKIVLEAEDDAATRNWGGGARTPIYQEYKELVDGCTWECTGIESTKKGKTAKCNGKSLFFPFTNYYYETDFYAYGSEIGYYWTGTASTASDNFASQLCVNNSSQGASTSQNRYKGQCVRAVTEK